MNQPLFSLYIKEYNNICLYVKAESFDRFCFFFCS